MDAAALRRFWLKKLGKDDPSGGADTLERSVRPDPTPHNPSSSSTSSLPPPPRCEPLRLIGSGGMGDVFSARQLELEREVALKKLKPDRRTSPAARASFLAEAVVTGRLEHPNVVPVYALGTNADDDVCLAMKLVEGDNWKRLIRQLRYGERAFHLEILLQVCNAVAYAHSRKIIHNDLKPENVMVGPFGEVMVLDWGLAVSFDDAQDPGSRVRHKSAIQSPLGTPAYMAPELARGQGDKLGPWTDIYLLGAILYEILTDSPPHRAKTLSEAVRHALAGDLTPIGAELPQELAMICTKAMARDPSDRHNSVQQLQDELRAYLRHRESLTIAAAAEARLAACRSRQATDATDPGLRSELYSDFAESVAGFVQSRLLWDANPQALEGELEARLAFADNACQRGDLGLARAQLARLHSGLASQDGDARLRVAAMEGRVATSEAERSREHRQRRQLRRGLGWALGLLVAGLVAGLLMLLHSNTEMEIRSLQIEAERERATVERRFADQRGDVAAQALNRLSGEVQQRLMEDLGYERAQWVSREILQVALEGWDSLRRLDQRSGRVTRESAVAMMRMADLRMAVDGTVEQAIELYRSALSRLEQLLAAQPEALELVSLAIQLRMRLASALDLHGQQRAALELSEQVLADLRHYGARLSDFELQLSRVLRRIGVVHAQEARLSEAEPVLEEALALARRAFAQDPAAYDRGKTLTLALEARANLYARQDRSDEARALLEQALEVSRQQLQLDPEKPVFVANFAQGCFELAKLIHHAGQGELAIVWIERGLELLQRQRELDPTNASLQRELSRRIAWKGQLLMEQLDYEGALRIFAQDLELLRQLQRHDPHSPEAALKLGESLARVGSASAELARWPAAREAWQESQVWLELCLQLEPGTWAARLASTRNLDSLGMVAEQLGELEAAESLWLQAIEQAALLCADYPEADEGQIQQSVSLRRLAGLRRSQGQHQEAATLYEACLEPLRARRELPQVGKVLVIALHRYGELLWEQEAYEQAIVVYRELFELARARADRFSLGFRERADLCNAGVKLVEVLARLGQFDGNRVLFEEVVSLARSVLAEAPPHPQWPLSLHFALRSLAGAQQAAGELELAETQLIEALQLGETVEGYRLRQFPPGSLLCSLRSELAQLCQLQGDFPAARIHFEAALATGLQDGQTLFDWARLEALDSQAELAAELLKAALLDASGPAPLYKQLWLCALGGNPGALDATQAKMPVEEALVELLQGEASLEALLARGAEWQPDALPVWEHLLYGFAGLRADFAGQSAPARAAYQACLATGEDLLGLADWVRARLARLPSAEPDE